MLQPGCLTLIVVLAFFLLLPFFFAHLMLVALAKLGLHPQVALLALLGIVLGGAINIPVKKIAREEDYLVDFSAMFGFGNLLPRLRLTQRYTVLAVNVGGCIFPCLIALYQCFRIAARGSGAVVALLIATAFTISVCYRLARPIPGIGIGMPAFIPPLMAAVSSLLLMPDFAPPIAFVAGVLGPLVGADLLHLRDIRNVATGMASIGGAGTFDGIVLSGLIAVLLA